MLPFWLGLCLNKMHFVILSHTSSNNMNPSEANACNLVVTSVWLFSPFWSRRTNQTRPLVSQPFLQLIQTLTIPELLRTHSRTQRTRDILFGLSANSMECKYSEHFLGLTKLLKSFYHCKKKSATF